MQKSLSIAFLFCTLFTVAQTGRISGTILDAKTGETLPGATVLVEGTNNAAFADFDGKFLISNVVVGKVTLVVSYISYATKKIADVNVIANDVTNVHVQLEPSTSQDLQEVEVVVTLNKENNTALVLQQKNNASVSDGISAETIKKTPDRSTADVIKRVSGATIQDNKFVIIRGMSDRYNAGFINGAPLPSSETDKKAFSFDMFPANILDNIVILKTGRPDLTGEFGGGIIQISTKNIPEKNALSISLGAGDNFQTTFKEFKVTNNSGKLDWIGIDDGSRALPKGIPTPAFTTDRKQQIEYAKQFNYNWGFKNTHALPNSNFQASLANVGLKDKFGSVFAISYNSNITRTFTNRQSYNFSDSDHSMTKLSDYHDTTYSKQILASALWNLSYKITPNHQISFKNIYSINSEDRVITRKGAVDATNNLWGISNVRWFTQNNIYSGQLIGDHYFEKPKIKFNWNAGYSNIVRDVPNLSRMVRTKTTVDENDNGVPYVAGVGGASGITPASAGSMLFLHTLENMKSLRYDVGRMFTIGKTKHEFQIGVNHIFRERTFIARLFGYDYYRQGNIVKPHYDINTMNDSEIFSQQNIGILDVPGKDKGGLLVMESTTPLDSYHAYAFTNAGYVMGDSRFFDNKLRLIYGARLESYHQVLESAIGTHQGIVDSTVVDILPSANMVYSLTDKINIRAAYYRTVARPEFRELAPFLFQDFTTQFTMSGNPNLKRSLLDNYDLRFEWYPGAGQVLSVSGFYKNIQNAIEQISDAGSAGNFAATYSNAKSAHNVGVELEYRFKLSTIFGRDSSKFLNNTTLFSNFAYIHSRVDNSNATGINVVRPLQGQSPFIINAGIQYMDNDKDWGLAISYNLIGRRIVIVGGSTNPTIWEKPRNVLDFQISKTFLKKRLDVKINLRDALAQNLIWYQDMDQNGKLSKDALNAAKESRHSYAYDAIFANTKLSPTLSFSIAYKIF